MIGKSQRETEIPLTFTYHGCPETPSRNSHCLISFVVEIGQDAQPRGARGQAPA